MTSPPRAKRRVFGRGYGSNPPSGRYSYQHQVLAKVVTMNAVCALKDETCAGPLEADHIVPRDAGGQSTLENLRPLCRRHNRRRGMEYRNQKSK